VPLTAVATFPSLPQAHRARLVLDEAGIDSEIGGEGLGSTDPFSPVYNRGAVQLLVDDNDASAAREALRTGGFGKAVEQAKDEPARPREATGPQHVRFAGLLVILMSILLLLSRGDPVAWVLIGIGLLLAGIGHVGVVRNRQRAAA